VRPIVKTWTVDACDQCPFYASDWGCRWRDHGDYDRAPGLGSHESLPPVGYCHLRDGDVVVTMGVTATKAPSDG